MSSQCESDNVLVLHAPDGAQWAQFLSARLSSPSYNITSTLVDITTIPESTLSSSSSLQLSPSSPSQNTSTSQGDEDEDGTVYTNEEEFLEDDDAVYTNDITIKGLNTSNNNNTNNNNTKQCNTNPHPTPNSSSKPISESIAQSRVCAIFISPDIVENENAFCVDLNSLHERRTVFLLLGVDLAEVMQYFGPLYDRVSRCRCCFIDGTENTIRAGIVTIIEAYEDDEEGDEEEEDVYKIPCQPVQRNTIEKVFPRMLTEMEREVFVLLSRIPEDDVQAVLQENSLTLPLKKACERMYSFVLPANIHGEINFQLECQGRRFGEESVHSYSKLDLIHNILTSELTPHSLIASSLGLDKDDTGGLDTALAFKLQELAPVMTFKALCPCEDALINTEEQSTKMWPTLLHFAAELNLRLLCSELLRYPGMVAAACTENRRGELPCQIANKKGFFQLENDLIEFMKRLRREVDPDYISTCEFNVSSSKESSTTSLSDTASVTTSPVLVTTSHIDDSGTYCDMSETQRLRKPLLDRIRQKPRAMSDSSLFGEKPENKKKYVTKRSLSGHSPSRAPVRTLSDRSDVSTRSRSGYSHRPLPKRPDSPTENPREEDTYSNPEDSPRSIQGSPTSQKALKRLGATEAEVSSRFSTLDPKIGLTAQFYSATCPPGTLRARLFDDDADRLSVSSNCDDTSPGWNPSPVDPKRGQVKEKVKLVKGFFQKIKGSKKSANPSDLSGKKCSGSKPRRGSEPAATGKSRVKGREKSHSFDEERDSGSYSDEEKKQKVFKVSNKPMTRRISRRIEYAQKESYGPDAPQLPVNPEQKRATFKSFIL